MLEPSTDTVAAIATAPGAGALSIVRVSGPRAREILALVFVPARSAVWRARAVRHGRIREENGTTVDDGLAWWAEGPATFTGEDVFEFIGHGGSYVTARVLEAFLRAGARAAAPGEFTRRAFLNGRMDLARAEAVADVISASTDDALRIARAQLAGGLSAKITALRDEVLDALAHVEATVDFPDEDLHPDGNEALASRFDEVGAACAVLSETFRRGRLYRDGARVVLAGRPNVGKSSLLNALSGSERAIVTDQPGTTRDIVEASIDVDGLPVTFADTAGLRDVPESEGAGVAEAEGVRRSRAAAADADLVVLVYDASEGFGPDDRRVAGDIAGRPSLIVANKCDLPGSRSEPPAGRIPGSHAGPQAGDASGFGSPATDGGLLAAHREAPALASLASDGALRVSARTGEGLSDLKSEVRRLLLGPERGTGDAQDVLVTRARHREALDSARAFLTDASAAARRAESPDLIASDARRALDALGEIVGSVGTEELLGRIFERFCVGK